MRRFLLGLSHFLLQKRAEAIIVLIFSPLVLRTPIDLCNKISLLMDLLHQSLVLLLETQVFLLFNCLLSKKLLKQLLD